MSGPFRHRSVRAACLATVLLPAAAYAQTAADTVPPPPAAAAPPTEPAGLADIVVTAQRRSEALQRTPLAITAITAATIETRRITDATDLNGVAPSLTSTSGPSNKGHLVVFIRGIGESEPILTADSPVSIYVDGVILGRTTGSVFELVDLERIEVLRGPQGTLYGRNTTGGAINLITKKPTDAFGVELLGSYGNLNYTQGRISVDTGLLGESGLKAKLSYIHRERQGWVDDPASPDDKDPGAYNIDAFRGVLAFDRGGAVRATYAYDHAVNDAIIPPSQLTAMTPNAQAYFSRSPSVGGTPFIAPTSERLKVLRPDRSPVRDRNIGHSFTAEVDLGPDTLLRSISGWKTWKNRIVNTDLTGNSGLRGLVVSPAPPGIKPVEVFGATNTRRQRQFSQELNLIGGIGERIDYVLGGYYFREKAYELNPQFYTFVTSIPGLGLAGINLTNTLDYNHTSKSYAAFGQVTYRLTDSLSVIGGLRYTKDEKKLVQTQPSVRTLKNDWSRVNYSATLQYQASPDLMVYGRVASGYKAGGFNARSVNDGYEPESLTAYEIGVKSQLLDRRLRVNAALFWNDLKDKQLNQFLAGSGGASSIAVNAGSATLKGVELEVEAAPVDGLRLSGALGYVDRDFKSFIVRDPATNALIDVADQARFSYSAGTTYNLGAEYSVQDVAGGILSARLDYSYRSKVYFNVVPQFVPFDALIAAPGFGLLDGRIQLGGVDLGGTTATFSLWGKNLTNKLYRTSGTDFGALGFAINSYGEPRTYGVDARIRF
ncbi:TonB-dependent receptor [Sphingomonas jatrophae]|uniref:Iron complex outermembrane recepter protein n=1 Tax=Sphingomonas jatrophae TaxID=1166337 RepID=A0A1I6KEW1_9SPHN|nr:TonB-dependent receptor [Sphingomonas jatrophae]SFR89779.1 iron complex outermembrane recepter protein [Sphingomonas jatrophae]